MNDQPTLFAVFELRRTWEEKHPELAKSGYGRFLEEEESIAKIVDEIRSGGIVVKTWPYSFADFGTFLTEIRGTHRPLLWNLTDGYDCYIGANMPAFMQLALVPHIGSSSYVQMLCQNKHHLKAVADSLGIPIARGITFDAKSVKPFVIPENIPPPYFVKPSRLDNSIGDQIAPPVCPDASAALAAIDQLVQAGIPDVMVEEYLPGNEFSIVAVNGESWIVECARIIYEGEEYLSSATKDADDSRIEFVHGYKEDQMIAQAMRLATAIKLHDYFRADYRCDSSGHPRLLEVNSGPFLVSRVFDELAARHFGIRPEMFKAIITQSYLRQRGTFDETSTVTR